jgi:hypothetical protein
MSNELMIENCFYRLSVRTILYTMLCWSMSFVSASKLATYFSPIGLLYWASAEVAMRRTTLSTRALNACS